MCSQWRGINGQLKIYQKPKKQKWNTIKTLPGVVAEVNSKMHEAEAPVSLVLFVK